MHYLCDRTANKVYAVDDLEFDTVKFQFPNDIELSEESAYLTSFIYISKLMEKKFYNYKNIDIMQECYYMLLKRYRTKGLFAPDKPFKDNMKMWYVFAKKSCLFLLRSFTNIISDIDIWSLEDDETDALMQLGKCDTYDFETTESTKEILSVVDKLCLSVVKADKQLGLYALCKLQSLDDSATANIMEVTMPRIYEIRRALKEYFSLRLNND